MQKITESQIANVENLRQMRKTTVQEGNSPTNKITNLLSDVTVYIAKPHVQQYADNYSPRGTNQIGRKVHLNAIKYMYSISFTTEQVIHLTLHDRLCDVINTTRPLVLLTASNTLGI